MDITVEFCIGSPMGEPVWKHGLLLRERLTLVSHYDNDAKR